MGCLFFFSSRRRHTRFDCDWSSDVCSSDLAVATLPRGAGRRAAGAAPVDQLHRGGVWDDRVSRPRAPLYSPQCTTDRKSTRLNSSHSQISYAVFCLKKKKYMISKHCLTQ